jgi:hypothetical protein
MTPSARLAEQTWRWCDGETEPVLAWLRRLGMTVCQTDAAQGDWTIAGLTGVTVGLSYPPVDPVGVAQMLGKAFFGMWWPQIVPDMFDLVQAEWRRRRKAARRQP